MYERYCALRASKNVKDADVSRNTGIPKSTFSDWKKGKSSPKQDKLKKIADYFGVSVEYLMTGKESTIGFSDHDAMFDLMITGDSELKGMIIEFQKLNPDKRKHIIELIKLLNKDN